MSGRRANFVFTIVVICIYGGSVLGAMTKEEMNAHCGGDIDCTGEGECFTQMCSCRNGRSSYPSCNPSETQDRNKCGGGCPRGEYCDKNEGLCMCEFGGIPGNCCRKRCSKYKSCMDGSCHCKYGQDSSTGRCRRCKQQCSSNQICRKKFGKYLCICKSTGRKGNCPTTSEWSVWGPWSICSRTCGIGRRERSRDCSGRNCIGLRTEGEECNKEIQCGPMTGEWGPWSPCPVTCGKGEQVRRRSCSGLGCSDLKLSERQDCFPADRTCGPDWTGWTEWSRCPVTCGQGNQIRRRTCRGNANACPQPEQTDSRECVTMLQPCEGVWSPWGEWSACRHECSPVSPNVRTCTKTRQRVCSTENQGLRCKGERTETSNNQESIQSGRMITKGCSAGHRLDLNCQNGCIQLHKALHGCSWRKAQINSNENYLSALAPICRGKSSCSLVAGSGARPVSCRVPLESGITYSCNGGIDRSDPGNVCNKPLTIASGGGGSKVCLFGLLCFG